MKISYNWLNEYLPSAQEGLPEKIEPGELSQILTSIGLEVEALEAYENVKGSLQGLVVGEVTACEQHPDADKLKVTMVDIGNNESLQIVCGAPNVAKAQKVIVAPVGVTIFPLNGEPVTMRAVKIRGVESVGMICAEDEIGLGGNHSGIFVLPDEAVTGSDAANYFNTYSDWIFEIGLTPNRMDAMSHIGVAQDVCAWLTHHKNQTTKPKLPDTQYKQGTNGSSFMVVIENLEDCKRYSALRITDVIVKQSPDWLQDRLRAIGQRPINNVVDITNFVLHETGQPLHAFDADEITSKKIIVKNLAEGTRFVTLDEVERKLSSRDLMICDGERPVCIAGVFGGMHSGVSDSTKNIFLESAWFNPKSVRETSLRHALRTEAAVRFEKGVDISGTVQALKRAAFLIQEIAGGKISENIIDVYPSEFRKKQVVLKYDYLKKLSGKYYAPDKIKTILSALGFEILREDENELEVAVPLNKMDVGLPADIVEEIVRIDGLDEIEISRSIIITPSTEDDTLKEALKEKISGLLTGLGFNEILTNSITNSKNFSQENLQESIRLLNNLSAELDTLRPSMLETGLEILSYNINRKNTNLRFFEFGKTYRHGSNNYLEFENFCFWVTGRNADDNWKKNNTVPDFFTAKGIIENLFHTINIKEIGFSQPDSSRKGIFQVILKDGLELGRILQVDPIFLERFDIRQQVVFTELRYEAILAAAGKEPIIFTEIPQFPIMERDLAVILDKVNTFDTIQRTLKDIKIPFLQQFHLFDVFESSKIGNDRKSFAINFSFLDPQRTLTDQDVEMAMQKIIKKLESDLQAEIRK